MKLNKPALIVIDVQQGFRDVNFWGKPANGEVYENIKLLTEQFRRLDLPIVVIRHDSLNPNSPLSPESSGNQLEPFLEGVGSVLITKTVNSAFYGEPDLHRWLVQHQIESLLICGITTNFCCETTARMASNLGYDTHFVLVATSTFDLPRVGGGVIAGAEVMQLSAANLAAEFASVYSHTSEFIENFVG